MPKRSRSHASGWRRLTPSELNRLGKSKKSHRYVGADVKDIRRAKTISANAYERLRLKDLTGENISRAEAVKRRAAGEISYSSNAAAERARIQTWVNRYIAEKNAANIEANRYLDEAHKRRTDITVKDWRAAHKRTIELLEKKTGHRYEYHPSTGKWTISKRKFKEPERLTEDEFKEMTAHVVTNYEIYDEIEDDVFRDPLGNSPSTIPKLRAA